MHLYPLTRAREREGGGGERGGRGEGEKEMRYNIIGHMPLLLNHEIDTCLEAFVPQDAEKCPLLRSHYTHINHECARTRTRTHPHPHIHPHTHTHTPEVMTDLTSLKVIFSKIDAYL